MTLELECLCIGLFGIFMLTKPLGARWAFVIVLIRLILPYTYFKGLWGNPWTLVDDLAYLDGGALYCMSFSPWDVFWNSDAYDALVAIAHSRHIGYYWWNAVAVSLFGNMYYAPVLLNVGISFATTRVFASILNDTGFDSHFRNRKFMIAYQAISPAYLSWISLINVKEALAEFLVVSALFGALRTIKSKRLIHILTVIGCFWALSLIRLYIPVILTAAFLLYALLKRPSVWTVAVSLALVIVFMNYVNKMGEAMHQVDVAATAFGVIRFLMTPCPWNIQKEYTFLLLPSVYQWAMIIPGIYGVVLLFRERPDCRLFMLCLFLFIGFYSTIAELQGPRHRVQFTTLMAWSECYGMLALFSRASGRISIGGTKRKRQRILPESISLSKTL